MPPERPAEDEMVNLYPLEFRPDYRYQAIPKRREPITGAFAFQKIKRSFQDQRLGISQPSDKRFWDLVWRKDGVPAYELAVVDDAAMGITEVVRGEDLLRSTARQLLLYQPCSAHPTYHRLIKDTGRRQPKKAPTSGITKENAPQQVKQLIQTP